ncbi:Fic family protein [Lysinibacter sp. HNR]|uniref:Fic/DOC family protein n=1 Tax=Lysinibacter sp. HNR TaxID=3031408 RepID=UPI0024353354|nr:Fic family protein [Lysinibacter sp. HNR]WGD37566.1 Fic family protein [Lysinibacter sp. HNR]
MTKIHDPYIDPHTGLLRNLVGAKTKIDLDTAEVDLSLSRLAELLENPPPPTGDLDELQAIHYHLFRDVYDWAGELRTVDIWKNTIGSTAFQSRTAIPIGVNYVAQQLRDENMLHGLNRQQFIDRLAVHYDELNYAHPFREGNGRTQRIFWSRIAADAGWHLDWRRTSGTENDTACSRAMEHGDLTLLQHMFTRVVQAPIEIPGNATVQRAEQISRLSL